MRWNRHRESHRASEDARLSTGYGDAAIQSRRPGPSSLDRFACARDDDCSSTRLDHAIACLADVARLENAWVEAYHAEDAQAATVGELAALSPDSVPRARIVFHPAVRLLRFVTPAATIWAAAQDGDRPTAPTGGIGEDALITRPDYDVQVRILPRLAHDFALRLREGATLIEAAQTLNDPGFDFGTHLVGLVESGAVSSILPGQPS